MSRKKKLMLYGAMLAVSLLVFVLTVFVFQKPDGAAGLVICIACVLTILGSLVKLCRLSPRFENNFLALLDLFSWLP